MTTSDLSSDQTNPSEISKTVEQLSSSSSSPMSSLLKIVEYLSIAAFAGVCLLATVLPDKQPIADAQARR